MTMNELRKKKFRWISQITLFPIEEIVNPALNELNKPKRGIQRAIQSTESYIYKSIHHT